MESALTTHQTFRGTAVKALIASMYISKPTTFENLWPHLQFQIPEDGHGNVNRDITRTDYGQLLFRAVKAYLMGKGHPNDPSMPAHTGLTPEQIQEERDDPDVRARLLLFAVLNKRRSPRGPSWKITVSSLPHILRCAPLLMQTWISSP